MIFDAGIVGIKDSATGKTKPKVDTKAFNITKDISKATHIKLKDSGEMLELDSNLIIKMKKDANGNSTDKEVHYSRLGKNPSEEFVCVRGDAEFAISPDFYTQIAFMRKSDNGKFLKCNDGVYVHKEELQIPAYKRVNQDKYSTFMLNNPVHDGDFYVQQHVARLRSSGKEIVLTEAMRNDSSVFVEENGRLFYLGNGNKEECDIYSDEDSRLYVKHVMIGDKIVETSKLSFTEDGKISVNAKGFDIGNYEKTLALQNPFIDIENADYEDVKYEKTENILTFPPRYVKNSSIKNKRYSWRENSPGPNGLLSVNKEDNYLYCNYADGSVVYYFNCGYKLSPTQLANIRKIPNVKIFRTKSIDFSVTSSGNVEYKFNAVKEVDKKNLNKAEDLLYNGEEVKYYPSGDKKINKIEWHELNGRHQISTYEMNGVKFSDIVWKDGEIATCKVEYKNEAGEIVEEEIEDLKNSIFKNLAIKCNELTTLENVKINKDATVSFKLGNYTFKDAVINEDGTIGKCDLKIGEGDFVEVDLATEPRFEQLRLSINTILVGQEIIPLIQSLLYEKKDGKYTLLADVVQTQPLLTEAEFGALSVEEKAKYCGMSKEQYENLTEDEKLQAFQAGVASAKPIESIQQAIEEQEKFKNEPYKTIVIDNQDDKKSHIITDFNTSYERGADFEFDGSVLEDIVGKDKIEIKKGECVIDSKKDDELRDGLTSIAFGLCNNPLSIIFGISMLFIVLAVAVAGPIKRNIKKAKIEKQDVKKYTQDMQRKALGKCNEKINELVAKCERELAFYKKKYSQQEYEKKSAELMSKLRFECNKEIGRLQILGKGSIKCPFDASKKTKLTTENTLGYLEYLRIKKQLQYGKEDDITFVAKMKEFNKTKFATREAKLFEQVRLMQELGGAKTQIEAYKLQTKNIKKFLEEENRQRAERGEAGISLEDYRKQIDRKFNEGRNVWGGIEDKLEAFKNSVEYQREDRKNRKKLLESKRESLEKELISVKVEQVKIDRLVDEKGNPVVEKATQSLTSYVEYAIHKLSTGDTKIAKCDENFVDTLTDEQKEMYAPTTSLTENTAREVKRTEMRELAFDRREVANALESNARKQQNIERAVGELSNDTKLSVRYKDYETSYKMMVALELKEEQFIKDCKTMEDIINSTPNPELSEQSIVEAIKKLEETKVSFAKQKRIALNAKKSFEKNYGEQVKNSALEEFATTHKTDYLTYRRYVEGLSSREAKLDETSIRIGFYHDMCKKHAEKTDSYELELETYKVKHHVEDNIVAEVLCEENREEFEKFIAERNEKSKGSQLDPNSEIARCYYLAHCKKVDPISVDKFKTISNRKCKEKAKQRLVEGTLTKHEKFKLIKTNKTEKGQSQGRSEEREVAPVPQTPVKEETVGLTA